MPPCGSADLRFGGRGCCQAICRFTEDKPPDPEDVDVFGKEATEQFADRIRLLSPFFELTGARELCYHDGILFGGHRLIVSIDAVGNVGEAVEAG